MTLLTQVCFMATLLHLDSSATGEASVSRMLSNAIVAHYLKQDPSLHLVTRDLDSAPLPHLTGATLGQPMNDVLDEFIAADILVIGVPRYNFGIPSTLKAWIDRIAVAGKTFRYTAEGPQGLAGNKRVILAVASGGQHAGTAHDFIEPYLRTLFGFLGVTDITFVQAEGVAMGEDTKQTALNNALARISQIPVSQTNEASMAA